MIVPLLDGDGVGGGVDAILVVGIPGQGEALQQVIAGGLVAALLGKRQVFQGIGRQVIAAETQLAVGIGAGKGRFMHQSVVDVDRDFLRL